MNYYQQMYEKLFNKITDVIDELQEIQQQAEEIYLSQKEAMPILMKECSAKSKQRL